MGMSTILKEDVQDILVGVRFAADATAASIGSTRDCCDFIAGYHLALEAVAAALGLELPSPAARFASFERWVRAPRSYAAPQLQKWTAASPE